MRYNAPMMRTHSPHPAGIANAVISPAHERKLGFRTGARGTHTSRTFMVEELEQVLAVVPTDRPRDEYAAAIVEENVTQKRTASTRVLTNQRLGELYALDPAIPLFRVLRRYWDADPEGRPLLALLCALARDPLLRATVGPVLALHPKEELARQAMLDAVRTAVDERLNDAIIDKVVRNASSTWTRSGHLTGRVRKQRQLVIPSPHAVAYALLLGYLLGIRGNRLFTTLWSSILDVDEDKLVFLAMDAKRLGALNIKHGGSVIEVDFSAVLTPEEIRKSHGTD